MLLIAANQDTVFKRLAQVMGKPELAEDERYASHAARGANMSELDNLINEWTKTVPLKKLEQMLNDNGVPCGLIYKASDMLEDEHFKARDAIVDVPHPQFGSIKMQNVAPKLSDTPGSIQHAGPELGEHNDYVFNDLLKLNEEKQEDYRERGIV